jgi:hypothetical protein
MANTLGAVVVFDGENPRIYTAKARTNISGGQFVAFSGAANSVGSGASSYTSDDVVVDLIRDSNHCNGIAINNAGSNSYVSILRTGTLLLRSSAVISGGQMVIPVSGTLQSVGLFGQVGSPDYALTGTPIGRNLISTASGTSLYTLVSINL